MKIEVAWEDMHDTVVLLGTAQPLFQEMAEREETPGMFKALLRNWATRAEELTKTLSAAANAASTPRTRTRRAKTEQAGTGRSRVRSGS